MAALREIRSPRGIRPTITAAAARRILIRVPYCRDMRARLARCGGTPRWEPDDGVWTMPPATLSAVVTEVAATFGAGLVRVEVADGSGQSPAQPAWPTLRDTVSEVFWHPALQDVPVHRVPSVDRPGHVWLSYELTVDLPTVASSPC